MLRDWLPPVWWKNFKHETLANWQDRVLHEQHRADVAEKEVDSLRKQLMHKDQRIIDAQGETLVAQHAATGYLSQMAEQAERIETLEAALKAAQEAGEVNVGNKRKAL